MIDYIDNENSTFYGNGLSARVVMFIGIGSVCIIGSLKCVPIFWHCGKKTHTQILMSSNGNHGISIAVF